MTITVNPSEGGGTDAVQGDSFADSVQEKKSGGGGIFGFVGSLFGGLFGGGGILGGITKALSGLTDMVSKIASVVTKITDTLGKILASPIGKLAMGVVSVVAPPVALAINKGLGIANMIGDLLNNPEALAEHAIGFIAGDTLNLPKLW